MNHSFIQRSTKSVRKITVPLESRLSTMVSNEGLCDLIELQCRHSWTDVLSYCCKSAPHKECTLTHQFDFLFGLDMYASAVHEIKPTCH